MADPNPKDNTASQYPGVQGVIPIVLGKHGEAFTFYFDRPLWNEEYNRLYPSGYPILTNKIGNTSPYSWDWEMLSSVFSGGTWEKVIIPSVSPNPDWTPENDVNKLPQGDNESDKDYVKRRLANKDKKELCIVEYNEQDALTFYCDSIEWNGNYAEMDRSGYGSKENPWRNVRYALHILNCRVFDPGVRSTRYSSRYIAFSCFPRICLRVKGTINYSVCDYDVTYSGTAPRNIAFNGYENFILTSWDDKTQFEVNTSYQRAHDNSGWTEYWSALSISHSTIMNCTIKMNIEKPLPGVTYFREIYAFGYGTRNVSCYNCNLELTGNSPEQVVICFQNSTAILKCTTKIRGVFLHVHVCNATYYVDIKNDIDFTGGASAGGGYYMSGCSTFGKIAHKNHAVEYSPVIMYTNSFNSTFGNSRYSSNNTIDIEVSTEITLADHKNSHPTVYGLYGDTQYSFVNGYPVMVSVDTHYNTYGVWMLTYNKMGAIASNCVVKMSVKANGYIHIQAIGAMSCYNCQSNVSINTDSSDETLVCYGIAAQKAKECSCIINGTSGRYAYVAGIIARMQIINSNADVTVKTSRGNIEAAGLATLQAIDSNTNVIVTSNFKGSGCDYGDVNAVGIDCQERTYTGSISYAHPGNTYNGFYALRCNVNVSANSGSGLCPDMRYSVGTISCYDDHHRIMVGSRATACGCVRAIQSNVSVVANGTSSAYARGAYFDCIDSKVSATANSTYYRAWAFGCSYAYKSECKGTTASASAAVADWDEFVEIVINTFDDKTYSYQEYQVKAALSDNEFALAKYVNENGHICISPLSGSSSSWQEWFDRCRRKRC